MTQKNNDFFILVVLTYMIMIAVVTVSVVIYNKFIYSFVLNTAINGFVPTTITFSGAILLKHITESEYINKRQKENGTYLLVGMIVYTIFFIAYIAVYGKVIVTEYILGILLLIATFFMLYFARQAYSGIGEGVHLVQQGKISG